MIPEIKIFLIAMSPIVELRGSIPIALTVYHFSVWSAFLISFLGNLVPAVFIILFLEKISFNREAITASKTSDSSFFCHRIYFFNRLFTWLFEKTRKRHTKKFERFKEFALIILVAIPLPFTGVWTGSICAFVFGIPFKKALPLITLGCLIAGIIVTLAFLGIIKIL